MVNKRIDEVADLLTRIPPIIHRKLLKDVFRETLDQIGENMSPHHLMIMKVLAEQPELCHSTKIGEMTSISKPQMTHLIDKLISLGLVERHYDLEDRRKIKINLTDKGRMTLKKIDGLLKNRIKTRMSSLQESELDKLADSLRTIADIFMRVQ
jgi:DNA-binding MarR family transcriptional regulator